MYGEREFQAEETPSAEFLKQKHVWNVGEITRRSVGLEDTAWGEVKEMRMEMQYFGVGFEKSGKSGGALCSILKTLA